MIRTISKTTLAAFNHHQPRLFTGLRQTFTSQALLPRTDFQNKSPSELREELNKRGIVTGSKKKSILIDKILEDEQRRMSTTTGKATEGGKTRGKKVAEDVSRARQSTANTFPEPVVSSPIKVAARLMSEPDGETPKSAPIQTGPKSASLGSPRLTLRSEGHQAQVWPASIELPSTPVEEPTGTVIPFIPNNWTSHQHSHAPQRVDLKPSSAEVSTASHPSTLPEGGPSQIVTDRFSPSITPGLSSDQAPEEVAKASQSRDQDIMSYLESISFKAFDFSKAATGQAAHPQAQFEFEDRPLTDRERNGLYKLLAFLGGSWLVAGLLGGR